jgi:hypothetical protein
LIWMLGIARHQKLGLVADAGHNELNGGRATGRPANAVNNVRN